MKRFVIVLFILLWFAVSAFAGTIPMSGTIRLANGNLFTGSVRFILSYSAAQDFNAGNIVVASTVQYPVNNGVLPANAKITPNDTLSPMFTWYTAQYINASGALVAQNTFYITGQSFNLGTATPTPVTTSNISFNTFNNLDSITVKSLDNRKMCDSFPGANAGAKMAACMAAVSNTGGIADASGIIGAGQTCTADPFAGVGAKPITLLWPTTQVACSASLTIPANVTVDFQQGGILAMATATTANVFGQINADISQHFTTGAGNILLMSNKTNQQIYPQWWGAVANGTNPPTSSTDSWPAIQAATDAIIGGQLLMAQGTLQAIQGATAGVVYFTPGTYYITKTIDLCHFNGCATGYGNPVAGVVNSCITFRGADRPNVAIFTDKSIDMFHMYSFACPSVVEHMTLTGSGDTTGIRIRGNQTTIRDIWTLLVHSFVVQNDSTAQTADTVFVDDLCDAPGPGGPGNCLTETDLSSGMVQGPLSQHIINLSCHGGNICINTDSLYDSFIDGVHSDTVGSEAINLVGAHNVTVSNVSISGAVASGISANETGIIVNSSAGVTFTNIAIRLMQGAAFVVGGSKGISLSNFTFTDDSFTFGTAQEFELGVDSTEITIKNGSITNNNGLPTNAIQLQSGGVLSASIDIDGVIITGSKFVATAIFAESGAAPFIRVNLENNDIRTSWASLPLIHLENVTHAFVHHNSIASGAVTTWLQSDNDATIICFDGNLTASGVATVGMANTSIGSFPSGCFTGAAAAFNGVYGANLALAAGGGAFFTGINFAALASQPAGFLYFCTDCKGKADGAAWGDTASGSGTGTLVAKEGAVWVVK